MHVCIWLLSCEELPHNYPKGVDINLQQFVSFMRHNAWWREGKFHTYLVFPLLRMCGVDSLSLLPWHASHLTIFFLTFSDTKLLLPFSNSGAIHGNVPLTPPETKVCCFTLDKPRSPTWNETWLMWKLFCFLIDDLPGGDKVTLINRDSVSNRNACSETNYRRNLDMFIKKNR